MARVFSDRSNVDGTDRLFAGAAKIRISPFLTCNSTSSLRPLSLSKGFGILIPLEFPIEINVVIIVITLYSHMLIVSRQIVSRQLGRFLN